MSLGLALLWITTTRAPAQETPAPPHAAESCTDTIAVLEREIAQLQRMLDEVHKARSDEADKKIAMAEKLQELKKDNAALTERLSESEAHLFGLRKQLEACAASLRETEMVRETLMTRSPEALAAKVAEGNRLLAAGRLDEAERLFRGVTDMDARQAGARMGSAVCRYARRDLPAARVILDGILLEDPLNAQALALRGMIAYREDDPEAALEYLERSVRIAPDDYQIRNYMGIVLYARGQGQAALEHLRRSVELAPEFAEARYNLARALASLPAGNKEEAKLHYQVALSLGRPRDATLESQLSW